MDLDYVFFLFLVPSLILLLLGAYVFWLDPGSRLGRSFALLCTLVGISYGMRALLDPNVFAFPGLVRNYVLLALPFAVAYFGFEFFVGQKRAGGPLRRWVPWVILAFAVAALAAYANDHDSLASYAELPRPTVTYGPLQPLIALHFLMLSALSALFLWAHVKRTNAAPTRAFFLAGVAFVLTPAYFGTFYIAQQVIDNITKEFTGYYRTFFNAVETIEYSVMPLIALASWLQLRRATATGDRPGLEQDARMFGRLLLALVTAGIGAGLLFEYRPLPRFYVLHFFVLSLCGLGLAALLAAVVLRHRLLEIEHHVNIVIRGGVVASIFVASIFVAVEVTAQFVSDNFTTLGAGGLVAGLMLFALHPLQRFAERVANRTLPNGRAIAQLDAHEKMELYREQARIAWADGALERKERLLLDTLRRRLGLTLDEASRLENQVLKD